MNDVPKDTSPEVYRLYEFMVAQLTLEERLQRAAMLFNSARKMILASLPKDLSPNELRRRLYERMYGEPLPADFPKVDDGHVLATDAKE